MILTFSFSLIRLNVESEDFLWKNHHILEV